MLFLMAGCLSVNFLRLSKSFVATLTLGSIALLVGCGGGGGGGTPPPPAPAPKTLASITVAPSASTVAAGATIQFSATGVYSDGSKVDISTTVTWTSSTPATATISPGGLATGVKAGPTSIGATSGSITGTTTLTVTAPTLLSIGVTPATPSIRNSTTLQFAAIGTYSDGTTQDITTTVMWTSATPATATISNAVGSIGLATALAVGTTSVTATSGSVTSPGDTLTVTPAEYAYVSDINNAQVDQYIIGTGGTLVPMTTPTVASGATPTGLAVDPTHHFVYVANFGSASVSQYTVGATGALTPMNPATVAAGSLANSVTIDATGTHAYVPNAGVTGATISQYTITPGTGALVPMTTPSVPAKAGAAVMRINNAGNFAYVSNFNANSVSLFSIDAGGALTFVSDTMLLGTNVNPNVLTIDSTGTYLYVADASNDTSHGIAQFHIDAATGALTPLAPAYVAQSAHSVTLLHLGTTDYLYAVASTPATVTQFAVNPASGDLGTNIGVSSVGTGALPISISFDPSAAYAYVANEAGNSISQFSVSAGGALTPLSVATVSPPAGSTGAAKPVYIATTTAY